jgi:hypothetical protein
MMVGDSQVGDQEQYYNRGEKRERQRRDGEKKSSLFLRNQRRNQTRGKEVCQEQSIPTDV